jgi:hypothetical protein
MKVISIKEYCQANKFATVAKCVRENTNGYAFITFITADNKAENVYFSKNSSAVAGEVINKDMLSQYQVAEVTNADGEIRMKLTSNSERIDIADLF